MAKKKSEYPAETQGTKVAEKARQLANNLTDEQREDAFRKGMARIYGGGNKALSVRH